MQERIMQIYQVLCIHLHYLMMVKKMIVCLIGVVEMLLQTENHMEILDMHFMAQQQITIIIVLHIKEKLFSHNL